MMHKEECTCEDCGVDLDGVPNILASIQELAQELHLHIDERTDEEIEELGRPLFMVVYCDKSYMVIPSPQWHGSPEMMVEVMEHALPRRRITRFVSPHNRKK